MAALAGMGISGGGQTKFDATDVNDQLGKTLNKGGLLMRMAQSKGQQVASSRGLSNSTIGIDAAQRAVVDAALPIAQQNAQQGLQLSMQSNSFGHDKDMAGINFTNQTKLNEQQNQFSAGQSALDRQQQTSILDKQQSFQSGQSALDRDQQLTMQGNEFKNQSSLTNQQAQLQEKRDQLLWQQQLGTLDKQGQLELQQLDKQLSNQKALNEQQNTYNSAEAQKDRTQQLTLLEKNASKDLAYMAQQVAANTHGMYLSAIDSAVSNYNERIAALEVAQDIDTTKKPEMKAGMEKELNATLQMYGQIYSNINTIRPDWTQFPTKVLPMVGVEQAPKKGTSGLLDSALDGVASALADSAAKQTWLAKTPTSGEAAARTTGTKPPVGTMLPTNVAAPIKPNVVTTPKVPTSEELAARSPKKVAAPIRPLDNRR